MVRILVKGKFLESVIAWEGSLKRGHYILQSIEPQTRLLGILLCWLQLFDGVFTAVGVSRFGLAIEGNPLLRSVMESYGPIQALFWIKLASLPAIFFLCLFADSISWVKTGMVFVSGLYLFLAILPWAYALS